MYIIGLTGGIACGKSAVTFYLKERGAVVYDIDKVTRRLLKPGKKLFKMYLQHFGEKILNEDGTLNRKAVGEIIFNDETERLWINSVAHPILLNHTRDFLVKCSERGVGLVVLELPLLFEVGWEFLVDETWATYVCLGKQIYRLRKRDNITREQALAKINSQMPTKEICRRADYVVRNTRGIKHLLGQIERALHGRFFTE